MRLSDIEIHHRHYHYQSPVTYYYTTTGWSYGLSAVCRFLLLRFEFESEFFCRIYLQLRVASWLTACQSNTGLVAHHGHSSACPGIFARAKRSEWDCSAFEWEKHQKPLRQWNACSSGRNTCAVCVEKRTACLTGSSWCTGVGLGVAKCQCGSSTMSGKINQWI